MIECIGAGFSFAAGKFLFGITVFAGICVLIILYGVYDIFIRKAK